MSKHQLLALWLIWLLVAVHGGAAVKDRHKGQQKQKQQQQQQQQQPPLPAFVSLFAATSAPTVAAFQSVQNYNHSLPLPLLKNGLVYKGSAARLRRVIRRLLHNEPVHIGVVGSAITYGRGVERGTSDWFSLFSSWLKAAFPAAKVTSRNGAVPLARSEYISACLEQRVDQQADLVFIEVTAADGYLDTSINNELVHALERLVRKLLQLPHKPAVVLLNALHPSSTHNPQPHHERKQQQQQQQGTQQAGTSLGQRQPQHPEKAAQQQQPLQQKKQSQQALPFYHTIEDHYGVVAQYYELPWLSLRNAVWQGLVNSWPGFKPQDLFIDVYEASHKQKQKQQQTNSSTGPLQQQRQQHPSYLPSRLGHQYLADLAVSLLQQVFVQEVLRPLSPSDAAAADELHVPMFPGNWEGHGKGCAAGVDLRAAVRDGHQDWYFVTEGSPSHPRWGFISHVPNATLLLQLDTRSKGAVRAAAALTVQQEIHLLQRHGLFAAAAELATRDGPPRPPLVSVPAAAPSADMQIWQGGGLEAATAEAERQAAAAAVQLRMGQVKPFVNTERLVGANPYSALQLPQEARLEVGKTKTATGVEVIMPGGRRLQDSSTPQQQQQQQALGTRPAQDQADRVPLGSSSIVSSKEDTGSSSSSSSLSRGSSSDRVLAAAAVPVIPPPYDAVYLKPASDGSSSKYAGGRGTSPGSNSTVGGLAAGVVGGSVFDEYRFLPQPRMAVLIGFLKAPRMMGRARIFCVSGCSCRELVVDGWLPHNQHRLATAWLHVTQSPQCLVGVQVLPETSTGHHKFKVTGVMVTHFVDYRTPGSEWAHQYFLHPELLSE